MVAKKSMFVSLLLFLCCFFPSWGGGGCCSVFSVFLLSLTEFGTKIHLGVVQMKNISINFHKYAGWLNFGTET